MVNNSITKTPVGIKNKLKLYAKIIINQYWLKLNLMQMIKL